MSETGMNEMIGMHEIVDNFRSSNEVVMEDECKVVDKKETACFPCSKLLFLLLLDKTLIFPVPRKTV